MMDATGTQFVDAVVPDLDPRAEKCVNHPNARGQAVCPGCMKLFCWECMAWHPKTESVICTQCQHAQALRRRAGLLVAWYRKPLFYVALLAVIGVALYLAGGGNEGPRPVGADGGVPWFKRRAGLDYVLQARWARRRAMQLELQGDGDGAGKWYALTAQALEKTCEPFGEFPCKLDVAVGTASALGKSGQVADGLVDLLKLDPSIPESDPLRAPYLYARAGLLWISGDRQAACRDWSELMATTSPTNTFGLGDIIDQTLDMAAGGHHMGVIVKYVRKACDTMPGREMWRARTIDKMTQCGIDRDDLETGGVPPPETAQPSGMKLERF